MYGGGCSRLIGETIIGAACGTKRQINELTASEHSGKLHQFIEKNSPLGWLIYQHEK